jgi:hypothetical protein
VHEQAGSHLAVWCGIDSVAWTPYGECVLFCLAVVAGGMTDLAAHARGFGRLLRLALAWLRPTLRLDHHLHHRCPEPDQLSPALGAHGLMETFEMSISAEKQHGIARASGLQGGFDCSVLTYHSKRSVCVRAIAIRERRAVATGWLPWLSPFINR